MQLHSAGRVRRQRILLELAAVGDRRRPSARVSAAPASSRLAGGGVPRGGQVDGRAAGEEAGGRKPKADDLDRHNWEIFGARDVGEPHVVPQHHVCVGHRPVLQKGGGKKGEEGGPGLAEGRLVLTITE